MNMKSDKDDEVIPEMLKSLRILLKAEIRMDNSRFAIIIHVEKNSVIKQPHRRRSPMIYGLEKWKAPPTMIEKLVCMEEARAYPRSDTHCPRPGIVANMRGLPARGRSRPKKLILHRQQHPVLLATLNVGTLTGRSRELADSLRKRCVDICCVQETRWKDSKSRELGHG
ncbi:hypothetical protein RB195_008374 [Necator americanus]|uniref:Endonuclease/exonuclease/phosphatase domain-containing protein n=1 Tax=Necator americanus TaxID=51031 RepID=A0ABR1CPU3_NECAM